MSDPTHQQPQYTRITSLEYAEHVAYLQVPYQNHIIFS